MALCVCVCEGYLSYHLVKFFSNHRFIDVCSVLMHKLLLICIRCTRMTNIGTVQYAEVCVDSVASCLH